MEAVLSDKLLSEKLTPTRNFEFCPIEIRPCRHAGGNVNCCTCQSVGYLGDFRHWREGRAYKRESMKVHVSR